MAIKMGVGDFDPTPPSGGGGFTSQAANGPIMGQASIFVGWGSTPTAPAHIRRPGDTETPVKVRVARFTTPFALLEKFDSFSRDEFLKLRNKLIAAGLVSENASAAEVRSAWEKLLLDVQDKQMTQGMGMSPFEFMNNLIRLNGLDPSKIGSDADYSPTATGKASSTTNTSTSVYDMDPASAQQLLSDTLASKLGRAPTAAEIEDFADAVKTQAQANPNVTVQHLHTDADGNTTQRTTQTLGFGADDAALMAEEKAKHSPDYAKYQAASMYYPALVGALGATVG